MEDTVNEPLPTLRHTVGFSRKVNLGNYESVDASIFIQFETPADADITAIVSAAEDTWAIAKAAVFEQLGVAYEIDPDTGEVTEDKSALGVAALEAAFSEERPAKRAITSDVDVPDEPPNGGSSLSKEEKAENETWAKARYALYPDEFYDNRPKKRSGEYKSTSPDLKHKTTGTPIWKAPR